MRPVLLGTVVVLLLLLAVTVYIGARVSHAAQVVNPGASVGIDVMSIIRIALSPKFWSLYIGGFVATYLATR